MLAALLLSSVLALQSGSVPDTKKIEAAVAELTAAFAKGTPAQRRVEALAAAVETVDARVIELVAKGLGDQEPPVVLAAADALGRMAHPDALAALHAFAKREKKKLAEDETLFPAVLKAIGRHGSASSIELLADDPFSQRAYATVQARVMALGNIRSTRSVEALIEMSKLVGPRRMDGVRGDVRLALARLTGRDLGPDSVEWLAWWQEHKKSFEVAKEPPELEPALQKQWNRYWGIETKPKRQ